MRLPEHPYTSAQAAGLGVTRAQLRAMVANGEVRRLMRGVYAPASLVPTVDLRVHAAALVVPSHCVVVDRSAAWLHGVDCWPAGWLDLPPPLEIVSANHEPSRRAGLLGGRRELHEDEVMEAGGVRLTTPLRTACDCARLRGRWAALAALDGFMRVHDISHEQLAAALPRFKGRRGCIQLRELAPLASPLAESAAESWVRLAIHDAGLPLPTLQLPLDVPGWGAVRLDLAYPRLRIAIEYDGLAFHSSPEQRARDAARRQALRDNGWLVIVLTQSDLAAGRLEGVLGRLGRVIEDRSPSRRRVYSRLAG